MIALHPHYAVLVIGCVLVGFGNGVADKALNTWAGRLASPSQLLGLLHGTYGFGAVLGPLAATTLVAKVGIPWYMFYSVMVS